MQHGCGLPVWLDAVVWACLRAPITLRWLPPLTVMGMLWWFSSRQPEPHAVSQISAFLHNGAHVVAYSVLGAALWFAITVADRPRARSLAVLAVAVGYGVIDELHQSYVPGRVCSVSDLITDACSAAMAVAWLRHQLLCDPRPAFRTLPWLSVCVAAVAFATWGPW